MSYLDLYKKRITAKGTTINERIIQEQHDNFYDYLERTPEKEIIIIDDEEYVVAILIKKEAEKEKFFQILAPLEVPIQQGTLILWDDAIWMVFVSEEIYKGTHFRGILKKCNHLIKWVDRYGKLREINCYIKGNVKGDFEYQTSSSGFGSTFSFVYGAVTGDIEIILPRNTQTMLLKEQDAFILNKRAWELMAKDDFSYEGIIGLLLSRNMKDKVKDDIENGIAQANRLNSWRISVESGYTYSIISSQEQLVHINIYHDNNLVVVDPPELTWEIDDPTLVSFDGNKLKGLLTGETKIKIFFKECPDLFVNIDVEVDGITTLNQHYSIEGNETIKEGGRAYTYIARRLYNGENDITANFNWRTTDPRQLISLKKIDNNICVVKTNKDGRYGKITIIADDGINLQSKLITIESII